MTLGGDVEVDVGHLLLRLLAASLWLAGAHLGQRLDRGALRWLLSIFFCIYNDYIVIYYLI